MQSESNQSPKSNHLPQFRKGMNRFYPHLSNEERQAAESLFCEISGEEPESPVGGETSEDGEGTENA